MRQQRLVCSQFSCLSASRLQRNHRLVVLNRWFSTPLGMGYQISCISDIHIIIHNNEIILWSGVTTTWGSILKDRSIRKVETHCHRLFLPIKIIRPLNKRGNLWCKKTCILYTGLLNCWYKAPPSSEVFIMLSPLELGLSLHRLGRPWTQLTLLGCVTILRLQCFL